MPKQGSVYERFSSDGYRRSRRKSAAYQQTKKQADNFRAINKKIDELRPHAENDMVVQSMIEELEEVKAEIIEKKMWAARKHPDARNGSSKRMDQKHKRRRDDRED